MAVQFHLFALRRRCYYTFVDLDQTYVVVIVNLHIPLTPHFAFIFLIVEPSVAGFSYENKNAESHGPSPPLARIPSSRLPLPPFLLDA